MCRGAACGRPGGTRVAGLWPGRSCFCSAIPGYGAPSGGPGAAVTDAGNMPVTEVQMVVAAERAAAFLERNAHTNGTGLQMEDALEDIILDAWLLSAGGNASEASEGLSDSEFAGELAACFAAAVHAGMPPPPPPPPGGEAGRLAPADAHGLAHPPPIPDRHSPPGPHPSAELSDGAERARGLHQGEPPRPRRSRIFLNLASCSKAPTARRLWRRMPPSSRRKGSSTTPRLRSY